MALTLVVGAVLCACGGEKKQDPPQSAELPASAPTPQAAPEAVGAAKPAAGEALIKCGDLLARGDIESLGFDASEFDEDAVQKTPDRGVLCRIGKHGHEAGQALLSLFQGRSFSSMKGGAEAAAAKGQLKLVEGPKTGSESFWSEVMGQHSLMFQSPDGRYAANLTSADRAIVEKLAKVLLANMEKN